MDDLLCEFLSETAENIAVLDVELVKLEKNPNDPELLSEIFRLVHTIKGTCGFLDLPRLEAVAHAGEEVLGKIRDGELAVTEEAVTLILESIDCIKYLLAALEETEAEPQGNDKELIARLDAFARGAGTTAERDADEADEAIEAVEIGEAEPELPAPDESEPAAAAAAPYGTGPGPAATSKGDGPADSKIASQNIRVGVDLLEQLMTTVSELVLTRNQLLQMVRGQSDNEFMAPLQRLSHVTTELQEGVMKTRMQPIGNAWSKLPRLIRDLSLELGKKVELKLIGADTELDRQVLELIKDPLTHMVRNAVDHAIEPRDERRRAGKRDSGLVTLYAYHEGGHIIIEVSDDGRGIDLDAVRNKSVQNGIVAASEIEAMSDQHILQLIFKPGFSTAAEVTNVSGRGVGMDVVKTNVEKIGGTIELRSVVDKGTKFTIKIPLTLAIVSVLIVECGGERFAIPQISVVELVRVSAHSEHTIETIDNARVLRLRDRLLPLVSLSDILKLGSDDAKSADADTFIVVAQVGARSFGISVDKVFDAEEIVVKPVAPMMRDIGVYSGNTILGDGSIVMILDPNGIAVAATAASMTGDGDDEVDAGSDDRRADDSTALLLFHAGSQTPKAVPLALVARLEEFDRSTIESSDGQPVVQYRGELMPLISIDGGRLPEGDGRVQVIVFSDRDRSMGLLVDEIVDIVDESLQIEIGGRAPGIIGSAIVATKSTDIIDTSHYLTQAFADWFSREAATSDDGQRRLLLVEDSAFFRNMLSPLLSAAGYDVTMVGSGDEALELLENGRRFDIIVSDIEMPGTSGFEFAKACRGDDRWKDTPIVALSSYGSPEHLERGREAGFTDYVTKYDREALLAALSQSLSIAGDAA